MLLQMYLWLFFPSGLNEAFMHATLIGDENWLQKLWDAQEGWLPIITPEVYEVRKKAIHYGMSEYEVIQQIVEFMQRITRVNWIE